MIKMKEIEEINKIKAVVEYILQQMGVAVDYIHLFKVMYFAQEEHLAIYGIPMMYDTFVARKHGPVASLTYKVLRVAEGKTMGVTDELYDFASDLALTVKDGHQVVTLAEGVQCDMDELSRSNVFILDKWIERCKDIESFDLSEMSHDKAWQKAVSQTERTGEDTKISLYDMAAAGGASKDMLNVVKERQLNRRALQWI
jgi:uncharacterized phage-associated protein